MLKYVIPVLLFMVAPATAAPIDFGAKLLGSDGVPYESCAHVDQDNKCDKTEPMTLGILAWAALRKPQQGLQLDDQVQRGLLAIKVRENKPIALSAEEVALIETQIAAMGIDPVELVAALALLDPARVKRP